MAVMPSPSFWRSAFLPSPATAWPLLLLLCAAAQAQEDSKTLVLDSTTVTATRSANSSFDLPASVSTVDRKALDDAQADSVSSVLRSLPNVNFGGGPALRHRSPPSVACRGHASSSRWTVRGVATRAG